MIIESEGEMFEPVKNYLIGGSNYNNSWGYDSHYDVPKHSGWKLNIDDYCENPDVYSIGKDEKIYLCQGKLIKENKGNLWKLIGQGISNRNYCNYLYIFFEKEYFEKIRKNELYYQDFKSILTCFNIGLLVVNNDLQVEEVFQAKEQNPSEKSIKKVREKILYIRSLDDFFRTILERSGVKPFDKFKTYLGKGQPSFYIYLDEWQKDNELKYFVKFYAERVLVGINASNELIQKGFKNNLLKNKNFTFTEYNGIEINENLKGEEYTPPNSNTHDFHVSIQLNQRYDDFFNNYNSDKSKIAISQISEKFSEIIKKMNPILRTLV